MWESGRDIMKSGASAHSGLAAPEDGRTPIPSSPPSLTHYLADAAEYRVLAQGVAKQYCPLRTTHVLIAYRAGGMMTQIPGAPCVGGGQHNGPPSPAIYMKIYDV